MTYKSTLIVHQIYINLSYTSLFQKYTYITKLPTQHNKDNNISHESNFYIINISHTSKEYFLYKRIENYICITRLEMMPLTIGEKWYLRLILNTQPVLNFKDARTVEGITFQAFQEAALTRKLVENENEATIAFRWAIKYSTPLELGTLYIIMTLLFAWEISDKLLLSLQMVIEWI